MYLENLEQITISNEGSINLYNFKNYIYLLPLYEQDSAYFGDIVRWMAQSWFYIC